MSFGGNVALYGTANIEIGDYTMIAVNVVVHTSTHSYADHPMWKKRIDRPVRIGKHVWIGVGAIILPGIKIGNYSVVGAGSVVTKHIPEYAIVAGNPAKIIKWRDQNIVNKDETIVQNSLSVVKLDFLSDVKKCQ